MSATNGDVLWQRGLNDESDWDDTALIEAYDRSISLVKSQLAQRRTGTSESSASNVSAPQDKKHKKWSSGEFCRAVYSEDGLEYEAKIKYISGDKCVVHYIGYGNEEEVSLSSLLPTHGKKSRKKQQQQAKDAEKFNAEDYARTAMTSGVAGNQSHNASSARSPDENAGLRAHNKQQTRNFVPPISHPPEVGGDIFPAFPPPPPPFPVNGGDASDEALASMLISWYMSGYHTGYYQAIRQFQNRSSDHSVNNNNNAS